MTELTLDDTPYYLVAILYLAILAGFAWGIYLLCAAEVLIRYQTFKFKHLSPATMGLFLVVGSIFVLWRIATGLEFGSALADQGSVSLHRHNLRAPTHLSWPEVASIDIEHSRRGWHQWDVLVIVDARGNRYKSVACTTVAEKEHLAVVAKAIRRLHRTAVQEQ